MGIKKICKNCKTFDVRHTFEGKPTNEGTCTHPKLEQEAYPRPVDGLTSISIRCSCGGAYSNIEVGAEFGCIHWEKHEEKNGD